MPLLVIKKEDVQISPYDQNQLRSLEITSVSAIQDDGSSTRQVIWDLEEAYRLGFTAVGRGEGEGQAHPPLPDFMTEEAITNEDRFFWPRGQKVEWTSQSRGFTSTKTGVIVDVVGPNELPSEMKWPSLHKRGIGSARKKISYVVQVSAPAGSAAQPKFYWPLTLTLRAVKPA